ncbi:16S rRNA (uracil(1498)-N(3))-methyltransferase [Thiovibrio sp. JS02]
MNIHRFFIRPEEISEGTAHLSGDEAHHLRSVLRLAIGDEITLFDGTGMRFRARLDTISKHLVSATIIDQRKDKPAKVRVDLGQALLKGQKMEFILQKATELGIDAIRPFWSEHGVNKTRSDTKGDRWQRIALEACKQCDRALPPQIEPPRKLAELLREISGYDLKLLFWEQETEKPLAEILTERPSEVRAVCFLIGPEGGFSPTEVEDARNNGFIPVSLGSRILRAETASLAAASILQFMLGNLSPSP